MIDILTAIVFFIPAGLANAAPVFANKIPLLNRWKTPLDFGKSWDGMRIFGDNKTWRGLASGIFVGIATGGLIYIINPDFINKLEIVPLAPFVDTLVIGGALGLGALIGDAVESFFKRRAGVPAGKSWFPFDQIDYIVGGLVFTIPLVHLSALGYVWILIVWFGMHLVVSYIGFMLHLKDTPI